MNSYPAVLPNKGKRLPLRLYVHGQAAGCTTVALHEVLLGATNNLRSQMIFLCLEQSRCNMRLLRDVCCCALFWGLSRNSHRDCNHNDKDRAGAKLGHDMTVPKRRTLSTQLWWINKC